MALCVRAGRRATPWVWDFNEYSSTGTITALERRIIAKAPAPKIVLLGNSRMRDAIAPRQLEDELGCNKGTVMNLAVSAGGTFEAKALYERNKRKLSRADLVVLNVDTWYLDETEPPTMNVRRFGSLADRLGIYGWQETASLVVGWAWRSYDVRDRYEELLTSWLEHKKDRTTSRSSPTAASTSGRTTARMALRTSAPT